MTKKYKVLSLVFGAISILLNIAPLLTYIVIGLFNSTLVYEKVAISLTVLIVLIMTVIAMVNKIAMKSRLWILLIGVYVAMGEIMTAIIIIAVCQILDEIIATPVKKHFKNKYVINREIDKRL